MAVQDDLLAFTHRKKLVLAFFADPAAAEAAVESLWAWDELDADVKLHGISVLALDDDGSLNDSGLRNARAAGAATGFAGWLLAVLLAGPIGPLLTLPIIGGVFGAIYHPGFGLSKHERERIAAERGQGSRPLGSLQHHGRAAHTLTADSMTSTFALRPERQSWLASDDPCRQPCNIQDRSR